MAKQIIVDFKVETGPAVKEVQDLKKEIQKVNKEAVTGSKGITKGFNDSSKASNKTAGGVKKIGTALKGLGIGLIIAAFAKFTEVLSSNQKVVDFFNTTFETLSLAFNDFFSFLSDNVGTVIGYFKKIFEDPGVAIRNFGKMIINNIIERFKSLIDALGFAGEAVAEFFSGNFDKAAKAAKKAGKELVDVATGVDGSYEKIKEGVKTTTESITSYVKSTYEAAAGNIELKKSAELAAIANQGLLEKFDLQAESLRQLRDDERLSIEERRQANDDLAAVLDEQEKVMLENAQISLAAAAAELAKDVNNIESKKAVMEAENELAAVRATVAGFRSEQLANDLALDKEEKEMINSKLEAESNLSIERKRFDAEQIDNKLARLEKQKEIDAIEQEQETLRLQAIVNNANEGTQAKIDAQIALDEFIEQSRQQNITRDKEIADEQKIIREADLENERNIRNAKFALANQFGQALQMLAGKNKTAAIAGVLIEKAASIGQIISSTGVANAKAVAAMPLTGGQPFVAINSISAGLSIATSLKSAQKAIQDIKSAGPGSASGVGSTGAGGGQNIPQAQAPAFNIVGATGTNQLATAIGQQQQQPVKAYVVSGDVTTAQSLERNIVEEASIGGSGSDDIMFGSFRIRRP